MRNFNRIVTITSIVIVFFSMQFSLTRCSNKTYLANPVDTARCERIMNYALEVAVDNELRSRIVANDPESFYSFFCWPPDTISYVSRTIETRDTSFLFHYNIFDHRKVLRLHQYIYHNIKPVNLGSLDYYFTKCMKANGLTVESCYFELIDLKLNDVIAYSGRPDKKTSNCIESEALTLDLFKTIAVKVYAEISKMAYVPEYFVISSNRP